ncbi:tetratricopeptide repeat protein [Pelosinus sp. sgz500959]|uniref:tetratricopeptide repeat protein n=1 Tax=Pelosinus sp. sgz500959 TaxID=3242472 RepID=UPI00366E7256
MGIFSWMFSKNTESNSHIRKWITTELEKVDTGNTDLYALFVKLIQSSVQWGKPSNMEPNDQYVQVSKQYLGDSTIFEITCYTYYQLEKWLIKNYPELKSEITLALSKWTIEKFYTTLYVDEQRVNQLFKEQLDRYKGIAGTEKEVEELHLEAEQRILMTKGDKFDKKDPVQDLEKFTLDSQYIKQSLASYEELHLSTFIASVQDYCTKNAKIQLSPKQNQELQQGQQDYLFGMALLAQKDWVRACAAFTKVLSANPKHYDALVQRGLLYVGLHQTVDALQDFTMAIQIKPNESAAYLQRAKCYHRKFRRREKALADYSMAIHLAANDASGYFGRGELYDEMDLQNEKQILEDQEHSHISEEFWAAIHDYSQAIALNSEHDTAYLNRALLYARKARINLNVDFIVKAIADFEQAISLNWENGYLYKQKDEMEELLEQITQTEEQTG